MIGATLCSGIGAPEMAAPWVDWSLASEIEAFPRAVLEQRFGAQDARKPRQGDGAALWGDFTALRFRHMQRLGIALPDLIVAGTPCQDFSIAGLRAGLDGERGNLTLEFVRTVKSFVNAAIYSGKEPPVIVWENVPGAFSIKGRPIEKLLLAFNDLGYSCDIDVLDAQFFGVPQRRRRVFIICQHVKSGQKKRSRFFATAGATFLTETLLTVLAEALKQYHLPRQASRRRPAI